MITSKEIRKLQFLNQPQSLRLKAHKVMLNDVRPGAIKAAEMVIIGLLLCLESPPLDGCNRPQPSAVNVDQISVALVGCIFLMCPLTIAISSGGSKRLHLRMD